MVLWEIWEIWIGAKLIFSFFFPLTYKCWFTNENVENSVWIYVATGRDSIFFKLIIFASSSLPISSSGKTSKSSFFACLMAVVKIKPCLRLLHSQVWIQRPRSDKVQNWVSSYNLTLFIFLHFLCKNDILCTFTSMPNTVSYTCTFMVALCNLMVHVNQNKSVPCRSTAASDVVSAEPPLNLHPIILPAGLCYSLPLSCPANDKTDW